MTETQGQIELRRNLENATREELLEIIIAGECRPGNFDWFMAYMAADHERRRLESLLKSEYRNNKSLRRAVHVADLEQKNKKLRSEIRVMQECAERHNREAYATGLIVNCTGCERGGPFNANELTEERVRQVELIAKRLRTWWDNHVDRKQREASK
jgi:hypothetical protein